jgi:uncharacterized protein
VKLPDTNVLLHAVNSAAPQHAAAKRWLQDAFHSTENVAFAWLAMVGFLRLSTRSGILARPLSAESALAVMNHWLTHPSALIAQPSSRHAALLSGLLMGAGTAGNLTNDAHLAAIAIEHGATLVSFDRDFERFAGLSFKLLK